MALRGEWVVLVASKPAGATCETLLGTGTVVARNCILTARHVVVDENGNADPNIIICLPGSQPLPAKIKWCGRDDLDIAVLEAVIEPAGLKHPLALLSPRDIESHDLWEAEGYAEVRQRAPSNSPVKVGGTTRSCGANDKDLILETPAPPEVWGGLSGAAVFIRSHVAGVVRSEPLGWDRKRLLATPVAAFLNEPGFREALGLKEDPLAEELAQLESDIARVLKSDIDPQKRPKALRDLAEVLASKLSISLQSENLPRSVARALLDLKARDVAMTLADLDGTLTDGDARGVVRALLEKILPLAVDGREFVVLTRDRFDGGANAVELPLRLETLAEIILAGADNRGCRFVAGGAYPQGAGRVALPPEMFAPFFHDDAHKLVDAVVEHLCREDDKGDHEWAELGKRFPGSKRRNLRAAVETRLRNLARKENPDRLSHYLLVMDAELDDVEGADIDRLWVVTCEAFGKNLPSLRLVRLRGGDDEFDKESEIAEQILAVRKRKFPS